MRFRAVQEQQLPDVQAEEVRREHARAIADLQRQVRSRASNIIEGVQLADATNVAVPHALGRKYKHVSVSPVTGASTSGRISYVSSAAHPTDRYVVLRADGYGATITVSLEVK